MTEFGVNSCMSFADKAPLVEDWLDDRPDALNSSWSKVGCYAELGIHISSCLEDGKQRKIKKV